MVLKKTAVVAKLQKWKKKSSPFHHHNGTYVHCCCIIFIRNPLYQVCTCIFVTNNSLYCVYTYIVFQRCFSATISRLTIVSHEAKKKQAIRDERVSYLQAALL